MQTNQEYGGIDISRSGIIFGFPTNGVTTHRIGRAKMFTSIAAMEAYKASRTDAISFDVDDYSTEWYQSYRLWTFTPLHRAP